MSSPKARPLLNLGEFVRGELSQSPPVAIPKKSKSGQRISSTAPSAAKNVARVSESGDQDSFYSASLIAPVMDESEVLLSSSATSQSSSVIMRHKEATRLGGYSTYGAAQPNGGVVGGGRGGEGGEKDYLTKSVNIDDEYVKIQMRNEAKRQEHATTNFQTFIHVVKGNIGTGLLALPLAVKNAGIILGPIGLFIMGIIAAHCMLILLDVANHLCKKKNMTCLNYAEAASVAAGLHTSNRKIIKAASLLVNIFLMITQFGFCSVYMVFIADNLNQVFCEGFAVTLGKEAWIAIMIAPVIVFCWIRNLEDLSPFSLVANLCILFCLLVIFYEEIYSFFAFPIDERAFAITEPQNLQLIGGVKSIALFFGSVVYAFEGIGMVLPLENKMKNPRQAKPVVFMAMVIVTLLYFIFGTMGYIVYGDEIKPSITLNLQSTTRLWASIIFIIVKLYFAYAIFASYMLQFYVPMDFLEPALFDLIKTDRLPYYFPRRHKEIKTAIQFTFRGILVFLTAIIALAVPDLGDLISLIGAVASSALALIFPALLEIVSFWHDRREKRFLWIFPWIVWVVKDCLILLLGIAGLMLGSYASISNIILNIGKKDEPCHSIYRH